MMRYGSPEIGWQHNTIKHHLGQGKHNPGLYFNQNNRIILYLWIPLLFFNVLKHNFQVKLSLESSSFTRDTFPRLNSLHVEWLGLELWPQYLVWAGGGEIRCLMPPSTLNSQHRAQLRAHYQTRTFRGWENHSTLTKSRFNSISDFYFITQNLNLEWWNLEPFMAWYSLY